MGNNPTLLKLYSDRFQPGSAVLVQGASSGLGRELAKIYAGRGCPMVVTGRNEEELQKLVHLCQSDYSNYNVFYITGDASNEDDCRKITEFMIKKHGRIDIVVLAAGVSAHGKFEDLQKTEIIKKIMDVNLFGYVNMTKYTLPFLKQTKGQYVVISSISGLIPLPLRTAYCASKFAVKGFFDALYMEESDHISITMYCPGTIVGSNFRNNSLSGKIPQSTSKTVVTVEEAAQSCINGADRKMRLIMGTHTMWFAHYANSIYPGLFEAKFKREAKL